MPQQNNFFSRLLNLHSLCKLNEMERFFLNRERFYIIKNSGKFKILMNMACLLDKSLIYFSYLIPTRLTLLIEIQVSTHIYLNTRKNINSIKASSPLY